MLSLCPERCVFITTSSDSSFQMHCFKKCLHQSEVMYGKTNFCWLLHNSQLDICIERNLPLKWDPWKNLPAGGTPTSDHGRSSNIYFPRPRGTCLTPFAPWCAPSLDGLCPAVRLETHFPHLGACFTLWSVRLHRASSVARHALLSTGKSAQLW